nr:hypothetical protein [Tanacetum cinerariifolium]
MEVFCEILQICPRILNQYFIAPPSEEDLVTFIQELGYSRRCISGKQQDLIDSRNHELRSCGDKTISMRNMIKHHKICDDSLLGTLKFVSKTQDYRQYGALIPDDMINQDIKDSEAYKTYYDFPTRKVPPRKARKYKKVASPLRNLSPVEEAEHVKKGKRVKRHAKNSTTVAITGVVKRDTPGVSVSKKKAPDKTDKSKV